MYSASNTLVVFGINFTEYFSELRVVEEESPYILFLIFEENWHYIYYCCLVLAGGPYRSALIPPFSCSLIINMSAAEKTPRVNSGPKP